MAESVMSETVEEKAKEKWNEESDNYNHWDELGQDEKDTLMSEIELLETAILTGEKELASAQIMVDNIHRKQSARRQELGFQKARAGMTLERVSHTPREGLLEITIQNRSGTYSTCV